MERADEHLNLAGANEGFGSPVAEEPALAEAVDSPGCVVNAHVGSECPDDPAEDRVGFETEDHPKDDDGDGGEQDQGACRLDVTEAGAVDASEEAEAGDALGGACRDAREEHGRVSALCIPRE